MTVLGNALKWAFLLPLCVMGVAIVMLAVMSAGYWVAYFLTEDPTIRAVMALLAVAMAIGALAGAKEAQR